MCAADGHEGIVLFGNALNVDEVGRGRIEGEDGLSDYKNAVLFILASDFCEELCDMRLIEMSILLDVLSGCVCTLEEGIITEFINDDVIIFSDQ